MMLCPSARVITCLMSLVALSCTDKLVERDTKAVEPMQMGTAAGSLVEPQLEPIDSGTRDAALADAGGCHSSAAPTCPDGSCTWADAQRRLPACAVPPRTPFYAARCGDYDAFVTQGIDSLSYAFYDSNGRLVATNELGLTSAGCTQFDASFHLPERCVTVTPKCRADDDAGT
jgi:hypothetical protein